MRNETPQETISPIAEQTPEVPFYIPATRPATRPRRTLKHDDTFAIVDSHGDVGASRGGADGIFHHDTRFLSRLELLLNGMQPLLLGSNLRDDNTFLTVDLTNPDIYFQGRIALARDTLHLRRTIFLWKAAFQQRVAIRNHGEEEVNIQLAFAFDGDFCDIFEVRGSRRPHRGTETTEVEDAQTVRLRYEGLDHKRRCTSIRFDPTPVKLSPRAALFGLKLAPGEALSIFITTQCSFNGSPPPQNFFSAMLAAHHEVKTHTRDIATVETSNAVFNEVLCQSIADLYMLTTETEHGLYPYAGTPWFSTTFGRDGLITAMQTLWFDPRIAAGVLRRLAALQATRTDTDADSEPGKILHEMRGGEMAALHEVPFGLYYGSVDSTPLFVLVAALYFERTGDEQTFRSLWPAIQAALVWIDEIGDHDRDGFIEYSRQDDDGLINQGWKDSHDSVFHADGALANGPIALAEVQAYVYAAKQTLARCCSRLGDHALAEKLHDQAAALAERFERSFWCEELGTYALALDGQKQPCRVRSSNAGQSLLSGMVKPERAYRVAQGLLHPHFFSGWGIRTVAAHEARYNPMSYHNGSIWPHDNALIAMGLAHYGMKTYVGRVLTGLFDAASYMELRRLPELFCGFRRIRERGPTLYPVACTPQAWASVTPFSLLQSCLGLELDPFAKEIRLRDPYLPSFIERVLIRNLRIGNASTDLAVHQRGGKVSVELVATTGYLRLVVTSS